MSIIRVERHLDMIITFISRYPYVIKIDELQSELSTLHSHTEALLTIAPHLRPYYKLFCFDGVRLFDSRSFGNLITLATKILSENNSTVGNHADRESESLVQKFKDLMCLEESN